MYDLTQSAAHAIPFVMVDTAGTEVAGLGATFTVALSANGGAFGASAGTKAELGNGWYLYTTTVGECATLGSLALRITGVGCVQQNLVYNVTNLPVAIDTQLSGTHGAGAWGAGTGVFSKTYTVTVNGLPMAGVYCRMTTDVTGLINIDAGTSNGLGQVTFYHNLPVGTPVWIWRTLTGYTGVNPDPETI